MTVAPLLQTAALMPIDLEPSDFTEGLHLLFPDGHSFSLTFQRIEELSRAILADPTKIPPEIRKAEVFQLCEICPKRESGDTCHAIRPVLALWDQFENYVSFDRVTAVYRSAGSHNIIVADTTMQRALQYVSVLSLLYYCEVGRTYWRYFHGVHPLMTTDELVARVYMNMFWSSAGNLDETRKLATRFHADITTTTSCQMARVRLFCHTDSFLNALILTQVASEFLVSDVEQSIQRQLDDFERALPT